MFFIYILYSSEHDRYYIGQCEDLNARLLRHNSKSVFSTRAFVPWQIIYSESYPTRAESMAREKEIKSKKSRKYIEFLLTKKGN